MKKLYRKGKVHPSPPAIADRLSLLPAAILTLTVALSPADKEVLAYLVSCSGTSTNFPVNNRKTTALNGSGSGGGGDHPPLFHCDCFRCYMSYWVRWDTSPNRQLIHEILDAYEDGLFSRKIKKNLKVKKEKKKNKERVLDSPELEQGTSSGEPESVELSQTDEVIQNKNEVIEVVLEKGPVRKLVSFIGERIWGVWGI